MYLVVVAVKVFHIARISLSANNSSFDKCYIVLGLGHLQVHNFEHAKLKEKRLENGI